MTFEDFKAKVTEFSNHDNPKIGDHQLDCIGWSEGQECCLVNDAALQFLYHLIQGQS